MFTVPHLIHTYPIINHHWIHSNLLQISISWLSHLISFYKPQNAKVTFVFDRKTHFMRSNSAKLFTPQNINELASFIATSYPQWRGFYTGSIKSNKVLWDIAGREGGCGGVTPSSRTTLILPYPSWSPFIARYSFKFF